MKRENWWGSALRSLRRSLLRDGPSLMTIERSAPHREPEGLPYRVPSLSSNAFLRSNPQR